MQAPDFYRHNRVIVKSGIVINTYVHMQVLL